MADQPVSISTLQAEMWVTHSVIAELIKASGAKLDWKTAELNVAARLKATKNTAALGHAQQSLKNIMTWSGQR